MFNEANLFPEDNKEPVTDRELELRVQHERENGISAPDDVVEGEFLENQGGMFFGEQDVDANDIGIQQQVLSSRQSRLDNLSVLDNTTIDLSDRNDAQREEFRNNVIQSMTVLNPTSAGQMGTVVKALLNNRAQ